MSSPGMIFSAPALALLPGSMKRRVDPHQHFDLSALTGMGSTGSPLPTLMGIRACEARRRMAGSTSGGTDVCIVCHSAPLLPVRAGELQCCSGL